MNLYRDFNKDIAYGIMAVNNKLDYLLNQNQCKQGSSANRSRSKSRIKKKTRSISAPRTKKKSKNSNIKRSTRKKNIKK